MSLFQNINFLISKTPTRFKPQHDAATTVFTWSTWPGVNCLCFISSYFFDNPILKSIISLCCLIALHSFIPDIFRLLLVFNMLLVLKMLRKQLCPPTLYSIISVTFLMCSCRTGLCMYSALFTTAGCGMGCLGLFLFKIFNKVALC